ncbi:hypothetical protein LCGC14_1483030, partial [marine sediment metagenome]
MTGELSLTVLSLSPLLKNALTGKTEHRFPEHGPSYTVEGPWEPWNASDEAREEARVWLEAIGDIERPLGRGACDAAIVELGNAVSMPKMSKDEAKGRLRVYHSALADLPGIIVLEGLKEAIKTCKWFPSVAELREIMEPKAKELRLRTERARSLPCKPEPRPKLAAPKLKGFGDMTKAEKD